MKKLVVEIQKKIFETRKVITQRSLPVVLLNVLLILFQVVYITLRYRYINVQIPFWYTKPWGAMQFASKEFIFLFPVITSLILITGLFMEFLSRRFFIRYLKQTVSFFVTLCSILLTVSVVSIIFSASVPFSPLFPPLLVSLGIPFVVGFAATSLFVPRFIEWANDRDLVTNPQIHNHPGMILKKPSARGDGFVFSVLFLVLAVVFIGVPREMYGIYLSVFMLGVLGLADDIQNTHRDSKLKALEHPLLRLVLLFSAVSVVVISGVTIHSISNPLGGIVIFDNLKPGPVELQQFLSFVPYVFTLLWIVWILNLLSWSNGIDGQYSGITGISLLFICLLSLRFYPMLPVYTNTAILAALAAGIVFGFTAFTWHPSAIMWGFGATSVGLVISGLSILINTKILTSVLILLVPFLDAVITFVRRLLQGKNPLRGDRGHLHHLLMERGWSVPKIALFYWMTTLFFGIFGMLASERVLLQAALILGGVVAFIIILLNVKSLKVKQ